MPRPRPRRQHSGRSTPTSTCACSPADSPPQSDAFAACGALRTPSSGTAAHPTQRCRAPAGPERPRPGAS
eukprot:3033867-Alexandrium_andersonii.AAC.1